MSIISLFTILILFVPTVTVAYGQQSISESIPADNKYVNESCGVSINLPDGWTATDSEYTFEDKSKTVADIQSELGDLFQLELVVENFGVAKFSPLDIMEAERDYAKLSPNSRLLNSATGSIGGFPSYKITYVTGSPGEYEFYIMEFLIIAYDHEYRFAYEAADKAEYDNYKSTIENMAKTIRISEPRFEGINC